jgi:mannose-6-phosphate isomerase-like protein (cupin superfamily)
MSSLTPDSNNLVRSPGGGTRASIRRFETFVQVRGEATGGAVALLEHQLAIGTLAMPLHRHEATEVLHVLDGKLSVQIGRATIHVVPAGATIVIPGGVTHTLWVGPDEPRPARFLAVVTPPGLERYYEDVSSVTSADGPLDIARVLAASAAHGVDVDMESIFDLIERHTLQLA